MPKVSSQPRCKPRRLKKLFGFGFAEDHLLPPRPANSMRCSLYRAPTRTLTPNFIIPCLVPVLPALFSILFSTSNPCCSPRPLIGTANESRLSVQETCTPRRHDRSGLSPQPLSIANSSAQRSYRFAWTAQPLPHIQVMASHCAVCPSPHLIRQPILTLVFAAAETDQAPAADLLPHDAIIDSRTCGMSSKAAKKQDLADDEMSADQCASSIPANR